MRDGQRLAFLRHDLHLPHAELSGIRRVPVAGFRKRLIFYQFRGAEILVLRLLRGARDLERLL